MVMALYSSSLVISTSSLTRSFQPFTCACPTSVKTPAGRNQSSWESSPHSRAMHPAVSLAPICHALHPPAFVLPGKIWKSGCATWTDKTKEMIEKTVRSRGRAPQDGRGSGISGKAE